MFKKNVLILFLLLTFSSFSQQNDFRLISWNIQDFGKTKSSKELNEIADIIREADIVAIQEVVAWYLQKAHKSWSKEEFLCQS